MKKIYIVFESSSDQIIEEKLTEYNADLVRISCIWLDSLKLHDNEIIYPITRQYEEPKFPEADILILVNVFNHANEYLKLIPHQKSIIIQNKDIQKMKSDTPEIVQKRRINFRE